MNIQDTGPEIAEEHIKEIISVSPDSAPSYIEKH